MRWIRAIQCLVMSVFLASCGGSDNTPALTLAPTPTPEPEPEPTLTPTPEPATFDVSGTITVGSNTFADSDVNDPSSPFSRNNTLETAQEVDNLSTIYGFLTHEPTTNPGDVFENAVDQIDLFRVTLQANQSIRMRIVDFSGFAQNGSFNGDLDLALFDLELNVIAMSMSDTGFEEIVVAEDGEYILAPMSVSGASKYVLDITSSFATTTIATANDMHNIAASWVIPNEAIVKHKSQITSAQQKTGQGFMHKPFNAGRASLVEFTPNTNRQKTVQAELPFLSELKHLNPNSYKQYQTLTQIKALQKNDNVEYVSPNFIRKALLTPNDPFFNLQWHYPAMNLPQAWDITTGTPETGSVIVAVVDTGVVLEHPELNGQLVPGFDFISNPNNALDGDGIDDNPDDPGDSTILGQSSWHGSHVAGTIAAESDNGVGVAGVSFGAKVMPLRVLGAQGGSSFDIIEALRFAAGLENSSGTLPDQPADIINLSLGGEGSSVFETEFYQELFDLGIIVVAAAGNDNTDRLFFPASYPGVISVAALDAVNNRAPYSNFGSEIDIAAPGGDLSRDFTGDGRGDGVLSTVIDDRSGERVPSFVFQNGTSMASPHIAGLFALMKAVHPALTAADVDSLLKAGSLTNDAGEPGRDDIFGHGIADALLAVQAAESLASGAALSALPASILATPSQINLSTGNSANLVLTNSGGGEPTLINIENPAAPWLTITETSVNEDGLGTYLFTVNRDDLLNGTYLVTVRFVFDGANDLQVNLSTTVGDIAGNGDVPQLIVKLVDSTTGADISTVQANEGPGNSYVYAFSGIPEGEYRVYAGSDIDHDGVICQLGELCGNYPTSNRNNPIIVNKNINDINILVSIFSSFFTIDEPVLE